MGISILIISCVKCWCPFLLSLCFPNLFHVARLHRVISAAPSFFLPQWCWWCCNYLDLFSIYFRITSQTGFVKELLNWQKLPLPFLSSVIVWKILVLIIEDALCKWHLLLWLAPGIRALLLMGDQLNQEWSCNYSSPFHN